MVPVARLLDRAVAEPGRGLADAEDGLVLVVADGVVRRADSRGGELGDDRLDRVGRGAAPRTFRLGAAPETVRVEGRVRAAVGARMGTWQGVDRMVPWSTAMERVSPWTKAFEAL